MDREAQAQCFETQLIKGDGTFNANGLGKFIKQVKLEECGTSYAIVAIMGPQSSGKSTLLNHLFHTNFKEMDGTRGRYQTTRGIWIARSADIEPCTIVMDLEGSDGQERGEDDTAFEKQSMLFAMAVLHIVMINMWFHDIGREYAAHKPLLRTVFTVTLSLFSPRRTTLMFVIRDKTRKTRFETLERNLRNDIKKMWDSIPKRAAHKDTQLSDFFNVTVVGLSSYENEEYLFKMEVDSLRNKFFYSTSYGHLASDRKGIVPASCFSFSAQHIWKLIKENKQLDLPSHTIMVADVICEKIAEEKYSSFVGSKDWLELEEGIYSHIVPGFGMKFSSLLDNCLSTYAKEILYFDGDVRVVKRKQLEDKLMKLIQPAYKRMLVVQNQLAQAQCFTTRLIKGDGTFNAHGLDKFIKQVKLEECGLSYAIVAIMGPQNTGKSTLLNHLFHTNFKEMDAYWGRTRTTKGLWIARCARIEPCTILMDFEGTNERELEDETTFEKQSAVFVMAVSHIIIINMWCHDIGRELSTTIPLLKTVFQVMLELFSPRRTTLMLVIRDKMRTPFETLEHALREDIKKPSQTRQLRLLRPSQL